MDKLTYAGEHLLTGSAIAHALLEYAQALAGTGEAATIRIPTVDPAGDAGWAEVLVGPASQLVTVRIETDLPEPVDPELVEELASRTAGLRRRAAPTGVILPNESSPERGYSTEYDL